MGRPKRHGLWGTPTYRSWADMKRRCTSPKAMYYDCYGGRGITVCQRWLQFENFLEDMGMCPPGLTLDRKNNDGNYEPGNCRWATPQQQSDNKRLRKNAVLWRGQLPKVWAAHWGVSYRAALRRIHKELET